MAQVTTNTQIDTINILQEANSIVSTDLLLLQRGSTTYKLQKENLIGNSEITLPKIQNISDYTVIGQTSGGGIPQEIPILKSSDPDSNSDTSIITEARVKQLIQQNSFSDIEFIKITSHDTLDLSYTANNTYNYTISGFNGTGLNTSNIRGLFVTCKVHSESADYYIAATYPDGSVVKICMEDGYNSDDDSQSGGTFYVPINKNQTNIEFTLFGSVVIFQIVGAQQLVFG